MSSEVSSALREGISSGVGDWYRFKRAVILAVDVDTGAIRMAADHMTPADACAPDEPAILFKSSSIRGNILYACTQTEILIYQLPDFTVLTYLSLPFFNDLHHVLPTDDGTLLVAISGLDMVVELMMDGTVVREWTAVPGEDPWERFSRDVDYRRIATTKPHHAHPNHVFILDGQPWATRFEQRDAICLSDPKQQIDIAVERPHDGVLHDGTLYFTTVDGRVVIADPLEQRVREIKVVVPSRRDDLLGWCRGIRVDDGTAGWASPGFVPPSRVRMSDGCCAAFERTSGRGYPGTT